MVVDTDYQGIESDKVIPCEKMAYLKDYVGPKAPCCCPVRTLPPAMPECLLFKLKTENQDQIQEWLLMDDYVPPVMVNKVLPITVHGQVTVKADLDSDVALWVIKKILVNIISPWCSQMHVVSKKVMRCQQGWN